MSSKQRDLQQRMTKNVFVKCGLSIVKSSNLDCVSSIHNPPASFLYSKPSILHNPTSILLYPSSTFHLQLFFLHPRSKLRDFRSKMSSKQRDFDKMSASAACTACSFFQVWRTKKMGIDRALNSPRFLFDFVPLHPYQIFNLLWLFSSYSKLISKHNREA